LHFRKNGGLVAPRALQHRGGSTALAENPFSPKARVETPGNLFAVAVQVLAIGVQRRLLASICDHSKAHRSGAIYG
jgi:hypothetical protein